MINKIVLIELVNCICIYYWTVKIILWYLLIYLIFRAPFPNDLNAGKNRNNTVKQLKPID